MEAYSQMRSGVSWLLRVYIERNAKQARSVPSSTIRSVFECMPGTVLENVLGVYLGASCELIWEHIVKQAGSVSSSAIGS
jgi:hypothetical protein